MNQSINSKTQSTVFVSDSTGQANHCREKGSQGASAVYRPRPTLHFLCHAPAKQAATGLTYLHRQVIRHGEAGHGRQSAVRVSEGCVCSAQHGARGEGGNCRKGDITNSHG